MKFLLSLLVLFAGFAACDLKPAEPPVVVVLGDGGFEEDSACGRACSRLRSLGCRESLSRDAGRSCSETCREGISDGLLPKNFAECVEAARDRAALAPCNVRCRP